MDEMERLERKANAWGWVLRSTAFILVCLGAVGLIAVFVRPVAEQVFKTIYTVQGLFQHSGHGDSKLYALATLCVVLIAVAGIVKMMGRK